MPRTKQTALKSADGKAPRKVGSCTEKEVRKTKHSNTVEAKKVYGVLIKDHEEWVYDGFYSTLKKAQDRAVLLRMSLVDEDRDPAPSDVTNYIKAPSKKNLTKIIKNLEGHITEHFLSPRHSRNRIYVCYSVKYVTNVKPDHTDFEMYRLNKTDEHYFNNELALDCLETYLIEHEPKGPGLKKFKRIFKNYNCNRLPFGDDEKENEDEKRRK